MSSLIYQRCFNHAQREAAARCPECQRYFCRECITEHEGRVICALCLQELAGARTAPGRGFAGLSRIGLVMVGVLTAWLFFYSLGAALLSLSAASHQSRFWDPESLHQP